MNLDITKIVQNRLKENQFFQDKHSKKQIVLHHTVSTGIAKNAIAWWNRTPERVGTAFVIDGDGIIHQCFSSAQWAHHLGCKTSNNKALNQNSIGIEICNWGGLTKGGYFKKKVWVPGKQNSFYSSTGAEVKNVVDYGEKWRGYQFYQKYTVQQIEATRQLLVYLADTYKITTEYQSTMWDFCPKALKGDAGIFTHVSFRKDKSDCHPQEELIAMLKSL
jgi:N-acetyl-anhydromuramyl-L-alanine amidase AmpD